MAAGPDWSDGEYERTARTLAPVAEVVLDAVRVESGERLLDVACGTGNAALAAARRGALVHGVDPADALVARAIERARESGIEAQFMVGDALALPVADGAFDAVVSVFGVIFAPDPERAAAELLRAGDRLALSSWVPTGPIAAAGRLLMSALPAPPSDPPRWGDATWVGDLLARHGATDVEITEAALPVVAASPKAWFEEHERFHPVWRWARRQLDEARWNRVREESVAALRDESESPDAFLTTSRYLVISARAG